ncbi:8-oxo-dGTP diphosphatase [Zafaria sp. Z1313]|uniref:8-oxo-dGTP diphosphatase n=1 Tax=unclassified Zafaria TaxID=2828765 RepID=UPI002E7A77FE|nr:NUDIX domain-containing protein [Zafaria sp. J156]MEE1622539.1 NUDIX domain-containing protein [Zafaria sp. J156]
MSTDVVLCLALRRGDGGPEVLLGDKLRGFGSGKTVLPGGKIEAGETPAHAAARELAEETGLEADPDELTDVATIRFEFPSRPASDMRCTVLLALRTRGTLRDSAELRPAWYAVDGLPAARMWEDSARWLGPLIAGRRLDVHVVLAEDNESVAAYTAVERP